MGGIRQAGATIERGDKQSDPDHDEVLVGRELVAFYRHLSVVAAQSADLSALTDVLAERLRGPVWLMSEAFTVLAGSGAERSTGKEDERISPPVPPKRVLRVASEAGSAVRYPQSDGWGTLIVAPVLVDFEVGAYLIAVESPHYADSDFALLALEHGATVCGIVLGRDRALSGAAAKAREDLVEGLLLGQTVDRDELARWAHYIGIDSSVPYRVMLFSCLLDEKSTTQLSGDRRARVNEVIKHFCESRNTGSLTVVKGDEAVALVPESVPKGPFPVDLAAECLEYCREIFADCPVTVVVSRACWDPGDIAAAYREVRRTTGALGRLGWKDKIVAIDDLGLHRLLLQLPDLRELRSFAEEAVGPLVRYDSEHGTQLVNTLVTYFNDGGSVRRMADHLCVHPNTVSYRLRRSAELGKFDLDSYRDRLAVQVALEILDLVGLSDGDD